MNKCPRNFECNMTCFCTRDFELYKKRLHALIGSVDLTDEEAFILCNRIANRTATLGKGKLKILLEVEDV